MKKNEVEVKKLKLRLSRETLRPLTRSDTQKVVGGDETDNGCVRGTSPIITECDPS